MKVYLAQSRDRANLVAQESHIHHRAFQNKDFLSRDTGLNRVQHRSSPASGEGPERYRHPNPARCGLRGASRWSIHNTKTLPFEAGR